MEIKDIKKCKHGAHFCSRCDHNGMITVNNCKKCGDPLMKNGNCPRGEILHTLSDPKPLLLVNPDAVAMVQGLLNSLIHHKEGALESPSFYETVEKLERYFRGVL